MVELIIWAALLGAGLVIGYRIGYDSGFSDAMKYNSVDWEE